MAGPKRYQHCTIMDMALDEEHPSDQTTVILTVHVSTEFWLDSLLRKRCQLNEGELEAFDLSYSKKLTVLKRLGMLPDDIHKNLKSLNELRNRFAHSLDYSLGQDLRDFAFTKEGIDFRAHVAIAQGDWRGRTVEWWRKALVDISDASLGSLEEYCTKKVGLSDTDEG